MTPFLEPKRSRQWLPSDHKKSSNHEKKLVQSRPNQTTNVYERKKKILPKTHAGNNTREGNASAPEAKIHRISTRIAAEAGT